MQSQTFNHTISWNPFDWFTSGKPAERALSPKSRAVADHKWILSERLGRDVGFKVAALDYRLNIRPKAMVSAKAPGPVETWFLTTLERLGEAHGAQTWARLPQGLENRRAA